MPPNIICVRHAQGYHNLGPEYHGIIDPLLTDAGIKQCRALSIACEPIQNRLSMIVTSPLSRTIQTAFFAFKHALDNGKCQQRLSALPDAQETFDYPFNTGLGPSQLRERADNYGWPVDLSSVDDSWTSKDPASPYFPASSRVHARARALRLFVRQSIRRLLDSGDNDVHIVIVSHGCFLHYLTDDWEDAAKHSGTGWDNCEYRTYNFEKDLDQENDPDARLVETLESRQSRGAAPIPPSRARQEILLRDAMDTWHERGLPHALELETRLANVKRA
jgi:broad specificity phosphatase PhoE